MWKQVHISNHPLVQHKLTRLRDVRTDAKTFRELIQEIAVLLAYEATADLSVEEMEVHTPLGTARGYRLTEQIGLVPILRAGLGMAEGIERMLPQAEIWHIGLFRDEKTLKPVEYYNRLTAKPRVQVCLILDPMLATGGSAVATVEILKRWGIARIRFVGVIAAPEGLERLTSSHPDVPIYLAAVDSGLNDIGFIVPGLGDAGDRQFGTGQ